jgi:penicillin G amidase
MDENMIFADKDGHVAWLPYAAVPSRPWATSFAPWLPIPGDGSAEWDGLIPIDSLPQHVDPPAGFVATSNNDMTGALADGDPANDGRPVFQGFVDPGFRHARVVELIRSAGREHDAGESMRIQSDVYSMIGARLAPRIVSAGRSREQTLTPIAVEVIEALDAWDYECKSGLDGHAPDSPAHPDQVIAASSIGCAAFTVLLHELTSAVFADELIAQGATFFHAFPWTIYDQLARPELLLADYWDNVRSPLVVETSTDTIVIAVERAASILEDHLGEHRDDWRWGRIHTLSRLPWAAEQPAPVPYAHGGADFTVDVAAPRSPRERDYAYSHGAAMRWVCVASDAVRCKYQIPGDAIQMQRYLDRESVPLPFTSAEVDASAIRTSIARPR